MLEYEQINRIPPYLVNYKVAEFLLEDIPLGDLTTEATVDKNEIATAELRAQENMIFVGEFLFYYFFDDKFQVDSLIKDGEGAKNRDVIASIPGPAYLILMRERVLLNIIQRLSGIATMAHKFALLAKPFGVKILDTRKTSPGLRMFERFAVKMGGGSNHRLDLSSGILIKDNHIKAAGGIKNAIEKCRNKFPEITPEIEVENLEQIEEALEANAEAFLLDNMTPELMKQAVYLIRAKPNGKNIFIEASGGMTFDNIQDYLATGINAVSIGALTHSFKSAEIHLEF